MDFSLEKVLLWIMDSYFSQKQRVELRNIFSCSFSLHKTLTDGLEWCGLL